MKLTVREHEVLATLTTSVRLLALAQIAAAWWPGSPSNLRNAARRVTGLVRTGLLESQRVLSRPLLSLSQPVYTWRPGDRAPDFGGLSWQLASRWAVHPRQLTVYFASAKALRIYGGATAGRIRNLCQVTHDLHLGTVYLIYRSRWPQLVMDWCGEDAWASEGRTGKVPDAVLLSGSGRPYRVIDFGGSYSARRLQTIHAHWSKAGVCYEIW